MGKKRKKTVKSDFDGSDKPSWAADPVVAPEKKPKTKNSEQEMTLKDYLDPEAMRKLASLKAAVTEKAEQVEPKQETRKRQSTVAASDGDLDSDRMLSFSELFDPEEDDDASFEALLEDSKLDWRYFKE